MQSSAGGNRPMADINVTPMVDVMLVLLVIFMVTAPLIQQGVRVELPSARAQALDSREERTVITITRRQEIYLGDVLVPREQLRERLAGNLRLRHDKEVFLHADRQVPYGVVVDVMALLKEAGVEGLGMVTDPTAPSPEAGRRRG